MGFTVTIGLPLDENPPELKLKLLTGIAGTELLSIVEVALVGLIVVVVVVVVELYKPVVPIEEGVVVELTLGFTTVAGTALGVVITGIIVGTFADGGIVFVNVVDVELNTAVPGLFVVV